MPPQSLTEATDVTRPGITMAKPITQKIKLLSTAGTGFFYVTKKNPRTATDKICFPQVRSDRAQARRLQRSQDQVAPRASVPRDRPLRDHRLAHRWGCGRYSCNAERTLACSTAEAACEHSAASRVHAKSRPLPLRIWRERRRVAGAVTDIGSGVEVRAAPAPACQVMDQRGRWPSTWLSIDPTRHH